MEPAVLLMEEKYQEAAVGSRRGPLRFLSRTRTVLTPALTLALLVYARVSLPELLSRALAHTSKEAMFLFCNGILLFLAKGSVRVVRPPRPCPDAGHNDGSRRSAAGTAKSTGAAEGRELAVPGMVVPVREVEDAGASNLTTAVVEKEEDEAERDSLMEADAGEIYEEEIPDDVYVQIEDDVKEEDDFYLTTEELYNKAEEFIENFKRQRRFEAMQLVAAR